MSLGFQNTWFQTGLLLQIPSIALFRKLGEILVLVLPYKLVLWHIAVA
jgi:hypothetical protein